MPTGQTEAILTVKMSSKNRLNIIPTLGVEIQKSFNLDADTLAVEETSPNQGSPPKICSRLSLRGPL